MAVHHDFNMFAGSRNHPSGFAQRTRKNLENIERAFAVGADVHVITQLMLSLLGIVVFPWESQHLAAIGNHGFTYYQKVFKWRIHVDTYEKKCTTLGALLRHLRNAVSHRNVEFSSDSRQIEEVSIRFHDRFVKKGQPDQVWEATVEAADLRAFLHHLLEIMDKTT